MLNNTLLYVEDDQVTRDSCTTIFKTLFRHVYTAADGKKALELYYEKRPLVVVLDIVIPSINGLEVARRIRESDLHTHIVILTAFSQQEQLLKAVNLKLDAYLLKPIDKAHLIKTMQEIISQLNIHACVMIGKDFLWDTNTQQLFHKDEPIKLTKKERLLLDLLGHNPKKYFSHDEIILYVWPDDIPDETYDKKLTQLIYRTNAKIVSVSDIKHQFIENGYAQGYRINQELFAVSKVLDQLPSLSSGTSTF